MISDGQSSAPEAPAFGLRLSLAPRINLALQQNAVPVIRELVIENHTERTVDNLTLTVISDPAFLAPRTWTIDRLASSSTFHISDLKMDVSPTFLEGLQEAVSGYIDFTLNHEQDCLAHERVGVQLLAKDEWSGISDLPEIIAAFIQPNDPAVQILLREASKRLDAAGQPRGLDGYQSASPQRVAHIASAIWSAVCKQDLSYAMPPASFEVQGQKVRMPSTILKHRLATCLDLTLLFAACLEQAGLHGLVIFGEGHSLVGCWLVDDDFSRTVVDDPQALRKRIQLKEMIVFETTLATNRPPAQFRLAVAEGAKCLEKDASFHLTVDIHRARSSRIRPISSRDFQGYEAAAATADSIEIPLDVPMGIPLDANYRLVDRDEAIPRTADARVERWKRKLLDLSMRNRLLNFKMSARAIAFLAPDPGTLEDKLADGAELKIESDDAIRSHVDPRDKRIHQQQRLEDLDKEQILRALARGDLLVRQEATALNTNLLELYRVARAAIQEGGANILYLALGFLIWKQDQKADQSFRAPLILIPVELTRRSVNSGFRLVLHEDEPRFNPTLLQLLHQDFGMDLSDLAGELPKDEHGLNVAEIWTRVRRQVRDIPGWEVVEDVVLSTFSFAKYLMWKDLEDRAALLKDNRVVRHLIETPYEAYSSDEKVFHRPDQLDDERHPKDVFLPLMADSSQQTAVLAAAEGKDFVLVGPPGTGKSQTIANMIAQCLAEGRTVLFVAEKTAALDVVYRRLRGLGLGTYCLELHSNKAKKAQVLEQLEAAWDSSATNITDWEDRANALKQRRDTLNTYVRRLHNRYPNGLTPYQGMGSILAFEAVPRVELSWASPEIHDRAAYAHLLDVATRIDLNVATCGNLATHPLKELGHRDWSPAWQNELLSNARALKGHTQALAAAISSYVEGARLPVRIDTLVKSDALLELAQQLTRAVGKPYGFSFSSNSRMVIQDLESAIEHLRQYQGAWTRLSARYAKNATALPLDELQKTWQNGLRGGFLKRLLSHFKVRKQIRKYVEPGALPADISGDLGYLETARSHEQAIGTFKHLASHFGNQWKGIDTDLRFLESARDWNRAVVGCMGMLVDDSHAFGTLRQAVGLLVCDSNEMLSEGGLVWVRAEALQSAARRFRPCFDRFLDSASRTKDSLFVDSKPFFEAIDEMCDRWISNEQRIHAWCAWQAVRDDATKAGLGPLVSILESGATQHTSAVELFRVNYSRWWVNALVNADDVLRKFVPTEHMHRIKEFRQLDEEFMDVTREYIQAALCRNIPSRSDVPGNSEWSVLSRELQKKTRHMPLRQLVSKMPDALTKLTPCVMMSPMSIAQYLPADSKPFDVVIFDEASQIATWDAVGAIARGHQAVVVGDPKQLPPTSFFARRDEEDINEELDVEDLESILDECVGAGLPTLQLSWHYRSRYESLITFSNHRYYGGRLVTFPSNNTEDQAVTYHSVPDGIYERGGARTNQAEARAIVRDIVTKLKQPGFDRSIGVVTFNTEQQALIENLFEAERRNHPDIEAHFAEDNVEALFVKNLESVQGDERDIIYFSITYGPDISRRVSSMNFGPMNQTGGPRRLNVAITRAREALRVFATLRPDQIDLSRTSADGVKDLKNFLEYAERGMRALGEIVGAPGGYYDSPFEKAVAERIRRCGWTVHSQIGVSGFRIDLGVVHPDAPGRYLAGIECDGATYHRSATARDRDLLRESALRNLGWTILRIWSTDWWIDAESGLSRIDEALKALLVASRTMSADVDLLDRDVCQHTDEIENRDSPVAVGAGVDTVRTSQELDNQDVASNSVPESWSNKLHQTSPIKDGPSLNWPAYAMAEFSNLDITISPPQFYDTSYNATLRQLIAHVLTLEAPIRLDMLALRIARAHGFQRTGGRILERVKSQIPRGHKTTKDGDYAVVWSAGQSASEWTTFRAPSEMFQRSIDEIPFQELIALAVASLNACNNEDDALVLMAREIGIKTFRATGRQRARKALASAARRFK